MSLVSYETRGLLLSDLTLSHACLPTCPHEWVCQYTHVCLTLFFIFLTKCSRAITLGIWLLCFFCFHNSLPFGVFLPLFIFIIAFFLLYSRKQHFKFQSSLCICPFPCCESHLPTYFTFFFCFISFILSYSCILIINHYCVTLSHFSSMLAFLSIFLNVTHYRI